MKSVLPQFQLFSLESAGYPVLWAGNLWHLIGPGRPRSCKKKNGKDKNMF